MGKRYGKLIMGAYKTSCRYRENNMNNLHSLHALDRLMENVSMWTKALPLGPDQALWKIHSQN